MRKRLGILFFCLLGCASVAATWWIFSTPTEPVYNGQPLNVWLKLILTDSSPGNDGEGAEAVRKMGSNTIPFLLQMLQDHDTELKTGFFELVEKQDVIHLDRDTPETRNYEAIVGFRALGPSASNAVPELIKIYVTATNEDLAQNVSASLGFIGTPASAAVPSLLSRATGAKRSTIGTRGSAICALGDIHSQPEIVVPKLTDILSEPEGYVPIQSVFALGKFGSQARMAVPLIIKHLDGATNAPIKRYYFSSLKKIDPDAAAKWERTNALHSTSSSKTALSN